MSTYGVTPQGFVPKTLQVIKEELEAELRAGPFGANVDLAPDGPLGQLVGIQAERLAEAWEVLEAVHAARDPDAVEGVDQDALAGLTGTRREGPRYGTVVLRLGGAPGTALPVGRVASVPEVGTRWETTAAAVIPAGGFVDVPARAQEVGPLVALAGSITRIETPAAGWATVTNVEDAIPGALLEGSEDLRLRREDELRGTGNAALDAIRARVLRVLNVTTCTVFENTTSEVDAEGLPPKSVEVLVQGGEDAAVAAAIFSSKAGGIQTHGVVAVSVEDSEGEEHLVRFTRPAVLDVYVVQQLLVDPDLFPEDGADQVAAAMQTFGDRFYSTGKDVLPGRLGSEAYKVPGVLDVLATRIGTAPAPDAAAPIVVSRRQVADVDTGRITITTSLGSL